MNTAREGNGGAGSDNTAALTFGGNQPPPVSGRTEDFNGQVWVEVADLSTARTKIASGGTVSAAWAAGGTTGSDTAVTEEWSSSSNVIKTLTD
jgi:hypothetical protein